MPAKQTTTQIQQSSLDFLNQLKENNNRDWFNEHKTSFQKEQLQIEAFADVLLREMNTHDQIETATGKHAMHRIYRDTRFSKDKTPYKTNWSGGFKRATKMRRGGYYFHIEPGNSFVAGGFWAPSTPDLKRIREEISYDPDALRKIISSAPFRKTFDTLQGEQLKTTPKGFDAQDEAIDLLRYKQFLLIRKFSDQEVLSKKFPGDVSHTYQQMRPFFDYMSTALTTDANGLAI
jgi:uncharacterized protein (TIGR02453 family)